MTNIEELTEEQLHQIINHIRHRFHNYRSFSRNNKGYTIIESIKDINIMKDHEILKSILNNESLCLHVTTKSVHLKKYISKNLESLYDKHGRTNRKTTTSINKPHKKPTHGLFIK